MSSADVLWGAVAATLVVYSVRRLLFVAASLLPPRRTPSASHVAPTVVLVVPARNEAAGIADLLAALERTDYPAERLTVVLVDDASEDGTGHQLAAYAARRPRTEVLALRRRAGRFEALNLAIAATPTSDLVVVCDADLRPRSDWLFSLVAVFADPSVGAAASYIAPRNARASWVARYAAVESWLHQLVTSAAKDRLSLDPPTHGAAAFRRSALDRIGGFPADVPGGDVWASVAIARAGWRTRFVAGSVVENTVVERVDQYWTQHLRWARNMFAAPSRQREGAARLGVARRLEARMMAVGYADRLSVVAALVLAAVDHRRLWLPLAYLAIAGAEVVVAVCKAGAGRELPRFVGATVAIFPLDALASVAAIAAHGLRRPRRWIPVRGERGREGVRSADAPLNHPREARR